MTSDNLTSGSPTQTVFASRLHVVALLCSSVVGLWLAIYLYGGLINPTEVEWLTFESDSLQHYTGWAFFREDAWRWPLGALGNLASEIGISIVYTDSIPLVALLLKPLHAWLPEQFQYLGLVMAINLMLNAGVACWVLMRSGLQPAAALCGALLMLSLPMVTMRGLGAHGHEALSAHWLLWLGIYLVLFHAHATVGSMLRWMGLLTVAVLVHFYLFFMLGVLWTGWWLRAAWLDRAWQTPGVRWRWLLSGGFTPALILLAMWAVGYFHYGADGGAGSGYAFFSAEVLTYFNPQSTAWFLQSGGAALSYFFPGWTTPVWGQYEGQAYAGLGCLVLLAIGFSVMGNRGWRQTRQAWPTGMPWLLLLGFALFVFALSDKVVLGYRVAELGYGRWLGPLTDALRSSGRLVWPLLYILLLAALALLARQWSRQRLAWVLAGLVVLQWVDMMEWHRWVHNRTTLRLEETRQASLPFAVLRDKELIPVWENHDHIVLLPADNLSLFPPYTWLAAKYHMSINVAYVARVTPKALENATVLERERLKRGVLSENVVYVLTSTEWAEHTCAIPDVQCREFEGVAIAWRDKDGVLGQGNGLPMSEQIPINPAAQDSGAQGG